MVASARDQKGDHRHDGRDHPHANGQTDPTSKTVTVRSNLSDSQAIKTQLQSPTR